MRPVSRSEHGPDSADDCPRCVPLPEKAPAVLQAEEARLHRRRAQIVAQRSFASGRGVALLPQLGANVGRPESEADLVFRVRSSFSGRHVVRTHAATDARGREAMRRAEGKFDSLPLMIAVGAGCPTQRMVFVPWSQPESCVQTLGKFAFSGQDEEIRIWLPAGVRLDYLEIRPYIPPAVPEAAATYQPTVVPPPSRPRIWMNAQSLPRIRSQLTVGENAPFWDRVRETAAGPAELRTQPGTEVSYDSALEETALAKAFVYLMRDEEARGREAVALIRAYLAAVEFGNLLDITREIGRAIYTAAQVYDWCYDLMSADDRDGIRSDLMRLATDMETGWPPFGQTIINGHGAEAQVNRDLLCMAIAIYDEDPLPYQYCAYRILEELVPMRRFEYQSPRHNQGISYGPSRFQWEMYAALLFYRMTGTRAFADNIMDVYGSWLYMRLPNGENLRDGDGFSDARPADFGITPLLCQAYGADPLIKLDLMRQGGLRGQPITVLLLNDPRLRPAADFQALPLSRYSGPGLGSMIARTGWNMGAGATDVVVEMKGGGYHFGNHQHADAGSFQIYFRGMQAGDLGQYHFYGTPYDYGFCKRSVSHSMMLVVDPEEVFPRTTTNDGGARFVQSNPLTPEQARTDPTFANGSVLCADFGPSPQRPAFTWFRVDLTSAYSDKIIHYTRGFCFLNLDDARTPAVLIIVDHITTAKAHFRKYWQINTLHPPEVTPAGVVLRNSDLGLAGRVDVRMLVPTADQRTVRVLSGEEAHDVFGSRVTPPRPQRPEAHGHRILFSPSTEQTRDAFLTVLSMTAEEEPELPIHLAEESQAFVLSLADRVVVLGRTEALLDKTLRLDLRSTAEFRKAAGHEAAEVQLLLAGLAPGTWQILDSDGKIHRDLRVEARRNTAWCVLPVGVYTIQPVVTGE